MSGLRDKLAALLGSVSSNPFATAVRRAQSMLNRLVASSSTVPDNISGPILRAVEAVRSGRVSGDIEQEFYTAYAKLAKLAPQTQRHDDEASENPFKEALDDADLLLKFAAETGVEVADEIARPILLAQSAYKDNTATDDVRAKFYASYSRLTKLYGDVTAETIRNCSARETRRTLVRNRIAAIGLTVLIAACSVVTFVGDSLSKGILQGIQTANTTAAKLRAWLTPTSSTYQLNPSYVRDDP